MFFDQPLQNDEGACDVPRVADRGYSSATANVPTIFIASMPLRLRRRSHPHREAGDPLLQRAREIFCVKFASLRRFRLLELLAYEITHLMR